MTVGGNRNNGHNPSRSANQERYDDLARQNREGHRQVERSLKEAERIANGSSRQRRTPSSV
jgi:hypothetical protein